MSDPTEYEFTGWDLPAADVRGNMDIHAVFRYIGFTYKHLLQGTLEGTYVNNRVTSVSIRAFQGMDKLVKVQMDSLLTIPESCFNGCSKLNEVSFASATEMRGSAFSGANALEEIVLLSMKKLSSSALSNTKIVRVNMPQLTTVGIYAFQYCRNLEEIHFASLKTIDQLVFNGCSSLKTIDIPNLVTIGNSAFANCTSLEELELPASVRTIDTNAFGSDTSLRTVIFRSSTMNSIAYNAFNKCTGLTDIYVPWAEGAVAAAPWGATNATIHYGGEWEV